MTRAPEDHPILTQSLAQDLAPHEGKGAPARSEGWRSVLERCGKEAPESRPTACGFAPSLKSDSPRQRPPPDPASRFCLQSLSQLTRSPAPPYPAGEPAVPAPAPRTWWAVPGGGAKEPSVQGGAPSSFSSLPCGSSPATGGRGPRRPSAQALASC